MIPAVRALLVILLAAGPAASAPFAAAQQIPATRTVTGVVRDSASGAGLAGARVFAVLARHDVPAGPDGAFRIDVAERDTLVVRAIGYRRARVPVSTSAPDVSIALAPAVETLGDLVVTASRRPARAAETAVQVDVVAAPEIAAIGAVSVDRVVSELPGLQLLPNAPTGADLAIRGIDGARVLVLIDGEPVPGGLLENRDLSRLSTVALDRIEVVKGPLSAIYGSDALGGVVNLVTRDPTGPLALEAEARAGDLGRRELRLNAAAGGRVSYRVDGSWREQTAVPSIEPSPDALSRVWDFRSTVRWAASGTLALRADANLIRERQRWQLSSDGFNGFNDNRGVTAWVEAAWLTDQSGWRTRLLVEDYTHRFRQARADRPLHDDPAPAQSERLLKASAGWNRRLGSHMVDAGLDASHRAIESPGKLSGTPEDQQVDGYAQDGWTLGSLLLQPAARISWNSRWGTTLTPSVAAAWEASPGLRLRATAGRGFRGPSFKELAWDYPNVLAGYAIRGNPDLRPERSWQLALGGAVSLGQDVGLDLEVFRNDIRDLIELVDGGPDLGTGLLLFTTRNVARARTEGGEASLRWTPGPWSVAAGYGLLSARDRETGLDLDRRARHQARLRLGRGVGAWHASAGLVYTSSAPVTLLDGTRTRQEALLSGSGQLRVDVASPISLTVGVDNAFDARPAHWTGLLGRRAYVGVSTRFTP